MHKHGCPTFMQMNHDGPWQADLRHIEPNQVFAGPPLGASPVSVPYPADFHNEVPRELTIPEIEGLVDKFASAAERAKKAGFDGVDVNAASSHLLHNFLSPFWNRREDIYGGSSENRTRFPLPGDPGDQEALRQGLRLHHDHQRARGRSGRGLRGQHDAHPADRA